MKIVLSISSIMHRYSMVIVYKMLLFQFLFRNTANDIVLVEEIPIMIKFYVPRITGVDKNMKLFKNK